MYALIHKNKVISGPKGWSQPFFVFLLTQKGIDNIQIPKKSPETLPYIIDDNTKICEVKEVRPEINTLIKYYRGPLWSFDGDIAVATYEEHYSPLDASKSVFKQLASEQRYIKESSGVTVNVQGTVVTAHTDRDSRRIFLEKYLLMNEQDTVNWKFPETWLNITKAELQLIINTGAQHIQDAFDWEKTISDQIDACTEPEQLLQITITEEQDVT